MKDWFDDYNSYHLHSPMGYLVTNLLKEKRAGLKNTDNKILKWQEKSERE
jgi:hypothetical protein